MVERVARLQHSDANIMNLRSMFSNTYSWSPSRVYAPLLRKFPNVSIVYQCLKTWPSLSLKPNRVLSQEELVEKVEG